jgi:hypothetical protein
VGLITSIVAGENITVTSTSNPGEVEISASTESGASLKDRIISLPNEDHQVVIDDTGTVQLPFEATLRTKNRSITLGVSTGQIYPDSMNIFIGDHAGEGVENVPGDLGRMNTFVGNQSGMALTRGYSNNFIGNQSGLSTTTGFCNIFIGDMAGRNNIDGFYNEFIGDRAGLNNTEGFYNQFIGAYAGHDNVDGYYNTYIGSYCGEKLVDGFYNVFVGAHAGQYQVSGKENVYIGPHAGEDIEVGEMNTFVGAYAGTQITSGNYNTFIGTEAGFAITAGTGNTVIGRAGPGAATTMDNTVLISSYNKERIKVDDTGLQINGALVGRVITVTTTSRTVTPADTSAYIRMTTSGAKTLTFNTSSYTYSVPQEYKITNRSVSGNITITGITLNGSTTVAPGATVTVKIISSTEADIY